MIATAANKYRFDPTDEEAIQMWDTTEGTKFLDTFFLAFRGFLGIVGALTLVVGGIGVSNIMNVVVEERTKEIGIKMALGAKRRYVIGQFLFETLLITVVGGIVGFLISWGICAVFPEPRLPGVRRRSARSPSRSPRSRPRSWARSACWRATSRPAPPPTSARSKR